MRCYGHMAHGTSPLYTSVRSLRDLHSLGPSALGCVNSVETCTSVYNGIGNGITCAIVPRTRSNAPETLPRILSARKDLVKGHLSRTFD